MSAKTTDEILIIKNLAEIQRHDEFLRTLSFNDKLLLNSALAFPDASAFETTFTTKSLGDLSDIQSRFDTWAIEKGITMKNDGVSATFTGEKAQKFAWLISNLVNMNSQIKNEIVPVAISMGINSLDIEGLDVVSENVETFLDYLEISYRDARF